MSKAIVILENVAATKNPALIKSVKYQVSSADTAIQNGQVVAIGALASGEREVHLATTPAATTTYFGLTCTPEVMYDEKKQMDEFENAAGAISRVVILQKGDVFAVTAEGFDTTPAVGKLVELAAATTLKVVASATSGSTQVGKIIEVETINGKTFYAVEVQ
jgi:hypothetical protein